MGALRYPQQGKALSFTILRAGEAATIEVEIGVRLGGKS
jgi:hypothetical protein